MSSRTRAKPEEGPACGRCAQQQIPPPAARAFGMTDGLLMSSRTRAKQTHVIPNEGEANTCVIPNEGEARGGTCLRPVRTTADPSTRCAGVRDDRWFVDVIPNEGEASTCHPERGRSKHMSSRTRAKPEEGSACGRCAQQQIPPPAARAFGMTDGLLMSSRTRAKQAHVIPNEGEANTCVIPNEGEARGGICL